MGCPLPHVPTQGNRDWEDLSQIFFPFPPPQTGREEERTGKFVLNVSEYKIVNFIFVLFFH
jgi:hypothetical protein